MDDLLTEDQQAENVKSWIRQNGLFLVAGVVLGLGALFGWNQWTRYQMRQAEEASALYETFVQAVRGKQVEQAEAGMTELAGKYGSTPYTDQARLAMARLNLEQGKVDKAVEFLQQVADKGVSPEFRKIGQLRLARVLIFQQKYADALKALKDPGSKAFAPAFHDVRGDVYFGMGKSEQARSEYEQALNGEASSAVIDRAYVQAKLDDLGGATAALAAPSAAPAPATTAPAAPAPAPAPAP
ncbi:MAG: tetratricopeptide repeat protein [Gammaproteobacteria bacterium]